MVSQRIRTVKDLVIADYKKTKYKKITLTPPPFKCVGEPMVVAKLKKHKDKRPSLEPVFGLSILGYCTNMVLQDGGLYGRGPTPDVDIKGSI